MKKRETKEQMLKDLLTTIDFMVKHWNAITGSATVATGTWAISPTHFLIKKMEELSKKLRETMK